jgi:O-antigen/teichoic acid export membrane protein
MSIAHLFARRKHYVDWLQARPSLRTVISNSGWLLSDKIIRMLVGVFVSAWVARYLAPARFGVLSYVLSVVAFFQAAANLGMDGIIVRDIAVNRDSAPAVLGTAFGLRLAAGAACWLMAITLIAALQPGDTVSLKLTCIIGAILVLQPADTIDLWFQSQSQNRRTVAAKLTAYFVTSGVKVALVLAKAPLLAFAIAVGVEFAVSAISLALIYRRLPTSSPWRFERERASKLLRQSWAFMLSGISVIFYLRIDQVMIKHFMDDAAVGIFVAALALSQAWYFIPLSLATSLGPLVARKKAEGAESYDSILLWVFRVFALLSLACAGFTALISPWIIPLIFGAAYEQSATVLSIHVFSNVFVFLGIAQSMWLVNENVGHMQLQKTLLGAILSVALNWLLIPSFGLIGAAVTAVIAQAFSGVLSNLWLAPKIFLMQCGIRVHADRHASGT